LAFQIKKSFDLIINFVGAGDPAKIKILGHSIMDITNFYDSIAIEYVKKINKCKYIFISSGAVYGDNFNDPIHNHSKSIVQVTDLDAKDYYSLSKIYSEYRHRALNDLQITDLRIFNYFSHTQDLSSSFFISEIMRSLISREKFKTSTHSIFRDYISPDDFFQIIERVIFNNNKNIALDCYSVSPVEKFELLEKLKEHYAFDYEVFDTKTEGFHKKNYYSRNEYAANIGYIPTKSSLSNIMEQANILLSGGKK